MNSATVKYLIGVNIAYARDNPLIEQGVFYAATARAQPPLKLHGGGRKRIGANIFHVFRTFHFRHIAKNKPTELSYIRKIKSAARKHYFHTRTFVPLTRHAP